MCLVQVLLILKGKNEKSFKLVTTLKNCSKNYTRIACVLPLVIYILEEQDLWSVVFIRQTA